jgi:predicted oxidoreductase (fatty acid repression mutant protein)
MTAAAYAGSIPHTLQLIQAVIWQTLNALEVGLRLEHYEGLQFCVVHAET